MKRLFSALCAALLLTGCAAQTPEEPVETQPKTKTVYIHKSMTRSQGNTIGRTDYIYDDENMLTDVIISNAAGEELERYLVSCDENGNPVEWTSATGTSILYTYDSQGRTLRTETYSDDTLLTSTEYTWSGALRVSVTVKTLTQEQRTEYTYDDKGCLIRQDLYTGGVLTSYGLFTLNEAGKAAACSTFDPQNNPIAEVTYEYDGATEKRTTTDLEGKVLQTQLQTYDEHGNLLENKLSDAGGLELTEVHEWIGIEVPVDAPRAGV